MTVAGGGHSRAREFPTRRPQAVTRPTVVAARATDAAQWHGHLQRPLGREIRMGRRVRGALSPLRTGRRGER